MQLTMITVGDQCEDWSLGGDEALERAEVSVKAYSAALRDFNSTQWTVMTGNDRI